HVVGTLEFAGIPLTGASLWTIAACRRKPIVNALLAQAGLPIPRWTVAQGKIEDDFPLPAIVKPAAEDASAGLDRGSVVGERKGLRARVAAMTEQFDEVLVQEYGAGREFNGGFVGSRVVAHGQGRGMGLRRAGAPHRVGGVARRAGGQGGA